MRKEHLHAEGLDEKDKNPNFGFKCLHYSVSEASGYIRINVDNKKRTSGTVRVCTIDDGAKAGTHYTEVKQNIEFKAG